MAIIAPQKIVASPLLDKKRGPQRKFSLHIAHLAAFLILSIVVLSLLYLSQFNELSSQGVLIERLERQRSQQIIENEVWNMRMARLKSLDLIEQQKVVQMMSEITPEELEFISSDPTLKVEPSD